MLLLKINFGIEFLLAITLDAIKRFLCSVYETTKSILS